MTVAEGNLASVSVVPTHVRHKAVVPIACVMLLTTSHSALAQLDSLPIQHHSLAVSVSQLFAPQTENAVMACSVTLGPVDQSAPLMRIVLAMRSVTKDCVSQYAARMATAVAERFVRDLPALLAAVEIALAWPIRLALIANVSTLVPPQSPAVRTLNVPSRTIKSHVDVWTDSSEMLAWPARHRSFHVLLSKLVQLDQSVSSSSVGLPVELMATVYRMNDASVEFVNRCVILMSNVSVDTSVKVGFVSLVVVATRSVQLIKHVLTTSAEIHANLEWLVGHAPLVML